jgi:hypothetical protein
MSWNQRDSDRISTWASSSDSAPTSSSSSARGGEIARAPALAQRGGALVQRDGLLALAGGEHGGEQLAQERLVVHERPPAEVAERRGSSLRRHALESRRRAPACTGPRARM